jgi:hypothetical protein
MPLRVVIRISSDSTDGRKNLQSTTAAALVKAEIAARSPSPCSQALAASSCDDEEIPAAFDALFRLLSSIAFFPKRFSNFLHIAEISP